MLSDYCKTVAGPKVGVPCVFPFEFAKTVYHGCTWEHSAPTAKRPWCSTKIDRSGKHDGGTGNWGFCNLNCTGILK